MEQQAARKTFKYKLIPTPQQEWELGRVLGLCRWLYNTALEQRIIAYRRARVSLSRYQQEADLKDIRAAFPEYAAVHSHVLQDALARLDKTYQAFFRRVQAGEKAGLPAFTHGAGRNLTTAGAYSILYILLGYPAGVVPVTRVRPGEDAGGAPSRDVVEKTARKVEMGSAGLPIGVQVVARPWREHVALAAMQSIEQAASAHDNYPGHPAI
jgi:Asp-tRNA(Asn)/Glu-tRNA(Gln) amidotransferase A subunit family amidase